MGVLWRHPSHPRSRLSLLSLARLQDQLDLPQMIEVVASHQADHVVNRFLAAFGVHTELFPLVGRERFQQSQVDFAQGAKLR